MPERFTSPDKPSYAEKLSDIKNSIGDKVKALRKSVEGLNNSATKGLQTKRRLESVALNKIGHFTKKYENIMDTMLSTHVLDDQERHALEVQLVNAFEHAMHAYFASLEMIFSKEIDSNQDHVALNEDFNRWMNLDVEHFLKEDFTAMPPEVQDELARLFDQSIPPRVQKLMGKVDTSPNTLDDKDLQEITRLSSGVLNGEQVTGGLGLMMLERLNNSSLYRAFEISMDDPNWGNLLLTQVMTGKLTVLQGEALVELALQYHNDQPEYSRKARKAGALKTEDLHNLKKAILREDMGEIQQKYQEHKAEVAKEMDKNFGRRNHAASLFSLKGALTTFGFVVGAAGLTVNLLTGNVSNAANVGNLGLMALGLEATNGLNGLLLTPRKALAKLFERKTINERRAILEKWKKFELSVSAKRDRAQMFALSPNIFTALQGLNPKNKENWPKASDILSPKEQAHWEKTLGVNGEQLTEMIHDFYEELVSFNLDNHKDYFSFIGELHPNSGVKNGFSNHETILKTA